jgi:hypothetical protein
MLQFSEQRGVANLIVIKGGGEERSDGHGRVISGGARKIDPTIPFALSAGGRFTNACGISVVSRDCALVEFIATDDIFTTNIAFGGVDMRDATITLSGSGRLAQARWEGPRLTLRHS